jgi:hypothetical protein
VEETGWCGERQLSHSEGEAERFHRDLQQSAIRVRVGMEAKDMRAGSSEVEHRPLGWGSRSLKREFEQLIISGYTQVDPDKVRTV